jgi:hypothetical protein
MLPPESALGFAQRAERESDPQAMPTGAAEVMSGKRTRTTSGGKSLLKMLMEADSLRRPGRRRRKVGGGRSKGVGVVVGAPEQVVAVKAQ